MPRITKTEICFCTHVKQKQAGHAGTTLLSFSFSFHATRERKGKMIFLEKKEAYAPESMLDFEMQIIT